MKRYLYILLYIIGFFNFTIAYSQETSKPATAQRIIEPTDPDCEEYEKFGWFYDNDGDGAGDPNYSQMACTRPSVKWVSNNNDCDDNNPNVTYYVWYYDKDHDGFGDPNYPSYGCNPPPDYVDNNLDCNDNNKDINPHTKWYLDTNGDGIGSDLDGSPIISCTKPAGDYLNQGSDNTAHWIHQISYDTKGNLTGASRAYFDDLGKSDVSLSKDYVTNKIWGTETTYDDFGRVDKTSFIAPSPLNTFGKTNFLKSSSEVASSSSPPTLSLNNITASGTYKASQSITATGTVSSGLNVILTAPSITLSNSNNFIVTASAGSSFVVTAANLPDVSANPSLANYYSDNNTDEPYQATATHPFAQTNYDSLNPGNVINVVGGNKINGEWKTGYAYTVPAAQEMYYVYGSDYYEGAISGGREEVITKFYKSVSVDANGNENVAFTDGEGKLLATARSGGSTAYPVVSLIGTQGYIDVHIPSGITSGISLIGGAGLYKIYDLKTGLITSGLTGGNAYRIEALTPPASDPKTYIAGGQPTYDSGALGITYNVNYYDYAVNVYNKTGQLIKVIQPNGYSSNTTIVASPSHMTSANFATTYKYNGLNQLIEVSNPDEGISKFAYRNDGQIRYSQSALQTDSKVSYTDYDELGRPKESGVMTGNSGIWSIASTNPDGDLIAGTRSEQVFTIYDYPENNATSVALPTTPNNLTLAGVLANAGISSTNYTQNNLSGNVAVTFTKPGSAITSITWYSYDLYGRAEWIVQYNEGIGAKTIHYEYDYKGNIKKVLFQKDKAAELFAHRYTYNVNDVLTKVETSTDNTNFTTHADYSYYKTGELKRVNIAQGTQGLDYVYTLGGQLKSINHPSLESSKDPGGDANDVFGLTLDYYNGDYLRTGRNITSSPSAGSDYNGNIKAARWSNKGVPGDYSGSSANQKGYLYNYNRNNWLTGATFGNTNSSTAAISTIAGLAEGGLTYDPNGNIQSLQRTNEAGTIVDKLTYNYTNSGKNQLNSITENAAVTTDVNDIENQSPGNYVYDVIGQLIQNVSENLYYFYNTQGLVTEVKKGANTLVKFFYNERGQRVKKESYNSSNSSLQSTTFYQLDLSGNTVAVYNLPNGGSITQVELPIYGLDRLGIYKKANGIASYEIKDHLGNVRAVIEKESGLPAIKSFADYYPFGEQLPSRNALSNYRYAFQGQELDQETGMEAFQLRLWDGRIGRWLSTDPYGQYDSPYLGMGNNPIGLIDLDGGFTSDCCPEPVKLDEVIVFSGKAKNFIVNYSEKFIASISGFGNALGSNMILGSGRFNADRWSNANTRINYIYGQLAGDITSMVWGAGEVAIGGVMAAGGAVLVPVSGGLSLAGSAAGVGIITHGSSVIVLGGINTAKDINDINDHFAKTGHSPGGKGGGNLDSKYTGKTANEIITQYRKGSVREVFPEELLESTWEEIKAGAAAGKKNYQTAKKLLTDGRFSK
ncbi:RHS repeat-associated core domain-containing protein [Flavobacterium anhuiense]|uniref:RHS repeat-associated core domain-containing protein n=1 Tax=Flavobacterium anhuiense TaxID=459526 RepID=A0ABY0L5W7_9FLAO|nr:RHS repeat-associated core domain-containing protein [Flavobacterium anhuiense]SCX80785.1 RHS repeat-associated core domain-containing protein [Flavobacterium anhuiense]